MYLRSSCFIFFVQQDLADFQEITNPKGKVLNPENNEQVDMGTC